jgi:hypothetical protein
MSIRLGKDEADVAARPVILMAYSVSPYRALTTHFRFFYGRRYGLLIEIHFPDDSKTLSGERFVELNPTAKSRLPPGHITKRLSSCSPSFCGELPETALIGSLHFC